MATEVTNTEIAILTRVLDAVPAQLSSEAARLFLGLDFPDSDHRRIAHLAAKANEGTLTPPEHAELENYNDVGHLLAWLQSRARQALHNGESP